MHERQRTGRYTSTALRRPRVVLRITTLQMTKIRKKTTRTFVYK